MRSLLGIAGVLALAVVSEVLPATAAAGGTLPVIYNGDAGWSSANVRPGWIYIALTGAPVAHTRHWSTWDSTEARSAGTLLTTVCVPNCMQGKVSSHKLVVTLSGVRYHDGHAYFSVMSWYTPGYRLSGHTTSTDILHFSDYDGSAAPFWH
jgi:hypothetical protein